MKIMIAVPINRPVEFRVFESFVRLANWRGKHDYYFAFTQNSLVYDGRETLVQQFLQSDAEALMFIDSDMTFHPVSIEELEAHKMPIVSAKAFKRVPPYQPCFYSTVDVDSDGQVYLESPVEYGEGLLPVKGVGMACCLIRREVFEKIEAPYFFPTKNLGEDLSFCKKVTDAGIPIYVDTRWQFGHLAQVEILEEHFQKIYQEHKKNGTLEKLFVGA